ncbi:MAG: UDP-N-acetylenolpyruvoylglucosamine reductase [Candidatus Moranbacteria bacterium GW2011_GWC1_45_18]|nr:MAG: UDP-N-acetylenolpyruvoylglucosamine reductase [Candidatus Moranbacteria bacterium GW2011_GWC2_40_12]KKT32754.1 MAG: UDP-N-acetylenolpyruvoylglucosamine reductase [Candidatus Moranbacteria bacterium GW2011_GWF2_44_10]KKT99142.1 MAG: UDP-N-acetylenolpyruvoylglucosamine reductase [Candidatus Moranbacteria bacterium GW2011_GWC1_45_18]OGI39720.1 MAG: UDP-N-acetylenolpyruvoylglucosamine reductase [Candidatus Moranbacteria bacterium RIFOXYB1_FULL_44_23]HBB37518.1 UDP-N-acetylenolpyruvoylglucos
MNIQENIPLAQYTTLKVGGAARFFCEAKNEEEISGAVKFAEEKKLPVFVLGGGSNILVSDKGFDGVVIRLRNSQLVIRNLDIICHGGCQLSKAVSESVKAGLTGLEWAAGIPGMVGGAVWGNAGAPWGSMADCVESVKVLDKKDLRFKIYDLKKCDFEYRNSIFKRNSNLVILSVSLKLKKGKKEESEKRVKEILAQRKEKQPMDFPSSGSFFANPTIKDQKVISEFERETNTKVKDNKNLYQNSGSEVKIPAAYLIEEAGLKGKKIGGAQVSEKHANFLVNAGNAKAEDFIILAAVIKTRVRNKFGIQLREEVQMVGF